MTQQQVLDKLAESLGLAPGDLTADSKADDFPEWDSMGVLSIMTMLAHEGITFDPGKTSLLRSADGVLGIFRDGGQLS